MMPTTDEIRAEVRALIEAELPTGFELTDQMPLFYAAACESDQAARDRGEAGLDSLDRVEILMGIEDAFNIEIPDFDVDGSGGLSTATFNNVDSIVAYLEGRLANAA